MKKRSFLILLLSYLYALLSVTSVFASDLTWHGNWFENAYVDEFGDKTDEIYYGTSHTGTFDNSVSKGADVMAMVYYDPEKEEISFALKEYLSSYATYLSSSDLSIKYKVDDDVYEGTLSGSAPNGDLVLDEENCEKIVSFLNEGKDIKAVIYIDSSKYNFPISSDGFAEFYGRSEETETETAPR